MILYVVMSGWTRSAAMHYIREKYAQRVLYQLPMSVSKEVGKTETNKNFLRHYQ